MFLLIKMIYMTYYWGCYYKNHLVWGIEDHVVERIHVAIDRLDNLYWRAFWRLVE